MTSERFLLSCPIRLARFLVVLLAILACALPASASWVEIHAIQNFDSSKTSPYLGDYVTTTGVVIAVLSDGFYIEDSGSTLDSYAEAWDGDTCTSEGIYVYTGSGNVPSSVVLKAHVEVYGLVEASNSSSYGGTQIYVSDTSSNISVLSTGNSYPNTVSASTVTTAINDGGCSEFSANSFGQWLPFEGMLINIPSSSTLLVTQGTGGTVTPSSQTATSNGQFWGLITSTTRAFRGTGIDVLDPAYVANETALTSQGVTTWDGNPALLLIDSKTLGGTTLDASAGTEYTGSSNLVGIVDYHISSQGYTGLLLTSAAVSALSSQSGNTPTAASSRLSTHQITFATLDLNSLVYTETSRMTKLGNAVVNYMKSPDVIAVQGADANSLNALPGYITTAGGPSYTLSTVSSADSSSLYNAFLVNETKFDGAPTVAQALCSNTVTLPVSGTTEALFDRCPLVLTAMIARTGISDFVVHVVNTNLMDRSDLSATSTSEDARYRREQQAQLLATQVLEPLETAGDHVMVTGGLNSFEFSDGYVDATGIIDGAETSSSAVWLYDSTYNSSALVNSTTSATNLSLSATNPSTSRYTYVESGSAEQPDQFLYTSEMSSLVSIDYARIGADFPVSSTYDTSTVARASSHDAVIAYFTTPYATMTTITGNTPNPSIYYQPVAFTVQVCVVDESAPTTCVSGAGTPDGTVTFTDTTTGTTMGTATLSSGVATFSYSALTVGTHTITAKYNGSESNLGYQASTSAGISQTVEQDSTTTTLTSSVNPSYYSEPVTLTATVNYVTYGVTPIGTVTFIDTTTSTTLGTATLSGGVATLSVSTLSVGSHVLQATYGGDTTDLGSVSNAVTQVVEANTSTLTLSSNNNPSYLGDPVIFTVVATAGYGTPTGTVAFYYGTTPLGASALSSGTATLTTSSLPVGTDSITAVYGGDGTHTNATSNVLSQVVLQTYTPVSTLTCSPNPVEYGNTVTCTDVLAASVGTPTGTVTFYDGSTAMGSATLASGVVTYSTSSLTVGAHSITAQYARNGAYLASTSNTVTEIVVGTFTLTAKPASFSLYTGESATSTITVTPGSGFTLDVALTCSGLPSNTTCTFTPSTVSGGSGTSQLVIQTTAPSKSTSSALWQGGRALPVLAVVLLFVPGSWKRRREWIALVTLCAALAATALSGCGGSGTLTGGTPAGTYNVTVTGTSTISTLTITETTTVALTVQSLF